MPVRLWHLAVIKPDLGQAVAYDLQKRAGTPLVLHAVGTHRALELSARAICDGICAGPVAMAAIGLASVVCI